MLSWFSSNWNSWSDNRENNLIINDRFYEYSEEPQFFIEKDGDLYEKKKYIFNANTSKV